MIPRNFVFFSNTNRRAIKEEDRILMQFMVRTDRNAYVYCFRREEFKAVGQSNQIVRQPDVVGRLKLYCCTFFVNAFFSDVAQRTSIKSICEVWS